MKQYKLVSINLDTRLKNSIVFYETIKNKDIQASYLEIEKKYIDVVYEIISQYDSYFLEIEFFLKVKDYEIKYYSQDEQVVFKSILNNSEGDKIYIDQFKLKSYIKFILRENIRAQILNNQNDVLFGYIYDFESLVYSDRITDEQIKEIYKKGFIIEEFYFSFDFNNLDHS